MHIHHSDSVIIWVMHSYAETLYCTEVKQQREKKIFNLQLQVSPAGFACTASIHSQ